MVLMTYDQLDRSSWFTIFVHELSHYLDQTLATAVDQAVALQNTRPNVTQDLIKIAQKFDRQEMLDPAEIALVDQWVALALERGMMAEIRAWTRTYEIYLDLKSSGLITEVSWVEKILRQKQGPETMNGFCKRYFNTLYAHPTTGMWSYVYLRTRLEALRAQKLAG